MGAGALRPQNLKPEPCARLGSDAPPLLEPARIRFTNLRMQTGLRRPSFARTLNVVVVFIAMRDG
jgi:DNA-binding transcriptional regulator YiaG